MKPLVVVASVNPVKLAATRRGFALAFPGAAPRFEGQAVASGVADQPMTDAETLRGARQRALAAAEAWPQSDFQVGLEGGLEADGDDLLAFAWVVVRSQGREGRSRSANFLLPPPVVRLVRAGRELGDASDEVFGQHGSKRRGGAVGLLTDGLIDRADLYQPAVVLALAPFLRPDLFGGPAARVSAPAG